jgi:hypothetical protein
MLALHAGPVRFVSYEINTAKPAPELARAKSKSRKIMNENMKAENQNAAQAAALPSTGDANAGAEQPLTVSQQPLLPSFSPVRGESDRAFEAFRAYLELGPKRRFAAVGRKVGASLRTVQRWACDFDWCGRIKTHAVRCAELAVQSENNLHHEELPDTSARAKVFHDRQFVLAEAILDVAERYLERVEDEDLDRLSLADACRALDFASRIARHARETNAATTPDNSLRDQLASLLDQACGETSKPA